MGTLCWQGVQACSNLQSQFPDSTTGIEIVLSYDAHLAVKRLAFGSLHFIVPIAGLQNVSAKTTVRYVRLISAWWLFPTAPIPDA